MSSVEILCYGVTRGRSMGMWVPSIVPAVYGNPHLASKPSMFLLNWSATGTHTYFGKSFPNARHVSNVMVQAVDLPIPNWNTGH